MLRSMGNTFSRVPQGTNRRTQNLGAWKSHHIQNHRSRMEFTDKKKEKKMCAENLTSGVRPCQRIISPRLIPGLVWVAAVSNRQRSKTKLLILHCICTEKLLGQALAPFQSPWPPFTPSGSPLATVLRPATSGGAPSPALRVPGCTPGWPDLSSATTATVATTALYSS